MFFLANDVTNVESYMEKGSIDGSWSNWKEWSDCQEQGLCGNRTKIRYRECSNPPPSNGGRNCVGSNFQCNTCPVKKGMLTKI